MTVAVANLLTLVEPAELSLPAPRDEPEVLALVAAAQAGDREAFGALVGRHERIILRTAMAALGRREDAEDAAQDALLVAWHKLPGFRGEASFRTWLLTIVWRKALDRRRSRSAWWRRQLPTTTPETLDPIASLPADLPDPERVTVARAVAAQVRLAINRLSPKLRDALVLSASGEHSYAEIAVLLKVPIGTVKWRVSEARKVIGAQMAKQA